VAIIQESAREVSFHTTARPVAMHNEGMRTLAVVLWLAMVGSAAAQDPGPTFQDSTGLTWSVATLEAGLALTAVGTAAADSADAQTVSILMIAATLISSGVLAAVMQALDAPVEPPMVFHQGLIGGALLGGLMTFSARIADPHGPDGPDVASALGVAGLLLGAGGAATYAVLRMDRLAHDPQLVEEAHLLSWGPVLTAGLLTAALGAAGLEDWAPLVGAISGLIFLGASVAAAEVAIAENPPPAPAPLVIEL